MAQYLYTEEVKRHLPKGAKNRMEIMNDDRSPIQDIWSKPSILHVPLKRVQKPVF